jgi:hypothetical protein
MLRFTLACLIALSGCAPSPKTANAWQPSALSENTIAKVTQASHEYFACIQEELGRYRHQSGDPRYATQSLLKRCEERLIPIRSAFAAEGVDPSITSRYLKRKRTQAARYALEAILELEAQQRAAQAGEGFIGEKIP